MSVKKVLEIGHPVLAARADEVDSTAIGSREVQGWVDDLIDTIAAGRHRAASDPAPLVRRFSDAELAVDWLDVVGRIAGREGSWASDLVLPRTVRQDLVLAPSDALASRMGWRADLALDIVQDALHGSLIAQRVGKGWQLRSGA